MKSELLCLVLAGSLVQPDIKLRRSMKRFIYYLFTFLLILVCKTFELVGVNYLQLENLRACCCFVPNPVALCYFPPKPTLALLCRQQGDAIRTPQILPTNYLQF